MEREAAKAGQRNRRAQGPEAAGKGKPEAPYGKGHGKNRGAIASQRKFAWDSMKDPPRGISGKLGKSRAYIAKEDLRNLNMDVPARRPTAPGGTRAGTSGPGAGSI